MRRLLSLVLLCLASPVLAQTTNTPSDQSADILAAENSFWTAYTKGDTAALDKLFTPDFTNVEQYLWDRQQVLDFVQQFFAKCSLAPVKILDPYVTLLSPTIATLVYHATESPTCGARTMSGNTNISTVWVLTPATASDPAHWQMHLHMEFAVLPPR